MQPGDHGGPAAHFSFDPSAAAQIAATRLNAAVPSAPPGMAVAMEELNQQAEHLRRVVEALRSKLGPVLRPGPPSDVLRADSPNGHAPRCDLAEGVYAFARIVREGRESIEEIIARIDV